MDTTADHIAVIVGEDEAIHYRLKLGYWYWYHGSAPKGTLVTVPHTIAALNLIAAVRWPHADRNQMQIDGVA